MTKQLGRAELPWPLASEFQPCAFAQAASCCRLVDTARLAAYTTNIATPAVNMAIVAMATTIHPRRELG